MIINENLFYFPINSQIRFDGLYNWKRCNQHLSTTVNTPEWLLISYSMPYKKAVNPKPKKCNHNLANVNGVSLALFRYGDNVYAIQSRCPHAGGPLHLGDIEDIGQGKLTVTCPWHKWKFELNSGALLVPANRHEYLDIFPVKVEPRSGILKVGFHSFHPSVFTSQEF
ncbi:hypothetical protein CHUAL_003419 [Chamberlinius hualienensis]